MLFVAPNIIAAFPEALRADAFMVAVVFPLALFWFSYLLKQFLHATVVLNIILGAAFVIAALSLLNAAFGQLSGDSVPVIYTEVPFFATLLAGLSGPVGLIYAGTIMTYGAYAYIFCISVAMLLEELYESVGRKILPKKLKESLASVDTKIDQKAVRTSDRFFIHNQLLGIGICLVLIAVYALLYVYLLIL